MNTTSNHYYKVGGSLDRDAPSYGVRQADEDFYQALKVGEFCYVLNSRQMGKSSLRVRTVARLEAEGIACSQIDITSIGSRGITASEWYWGVVRRLARSFKISIDLKTWWQERAEASPVDRLSQFIEEVLLVEVQSSIAIFIDEIDSILNLDFKDDFFALIRTCYNQRAENPEYRRLTFALLGVATPSDLIQDKSRTPFNIGRSIDLRGLQLHEAEPLAQGLQEKAEDAIAVLKSILDWTGGQPFLTQKICQFVQSETDWIPAGQEAERVRSLVQSRVIENWEGQDEPEHLRTIQNRVTREDDRKGQLLGLYQQVLEQGAISATESEEQIRLRLSGLVVKDQGQLKPHNRIYAAVFDLAWAERILAELRPYAEAIAIWLKSEGRDESRLLRGNALEEAQRWAAEKHLGEHDVRFLSVSEQAEKQVMVEENRILTEAGRKANRRLKMTGGLLGLAVMIALGAGIWANHAKENARKVEQERTQVEEQLKRLNTNLETSVDRQRETKAQLRTLEAQRHRTQRQLAEVSGQAFNLRNEITQLQSEKKALTEQRKEVKAQIVKRDAQIAERDAQIAERDAQITERTALIEQRDREINERDQFISQRGAELKKLEQQRAFLDAAMQQIQEDVQRIRRGELSIYRTQVLSSGVVRVVEQGGAKAAVDQLLQLANQTAIQSLRLGQNNQQIVQIPISEVQNLIRQIQDGKDYLVRVQAGENYGLGDDRGVFVNMSAVPNQVVFLAGDTIATQTLEPSKLSPQDFQKTLKYLVAASNDRARAAGVLNDRIEIEGLFRLGLFIDQLRRYPAPVELRAVASDKTYTSGPLKIELVAVQNGQVVLRASS